MDVSIEPSKLEICICSINYCYFLIFNFYINIYIYIYIYFFFFFFFFFFTEEKKSDEPEVPLRPVDPERGKVWRVEYFQIILLVNISA